MKLRKLSQKGHGHLLLFVALIVGLVGVVGYKVAVQSGQADQLAHSTSYVDTGDGHRLPLTPTPTPKKKATKKPSTPTTTPTSAATPISDVNHTTHPSIFCPSGSTPNYSTHKCVTIVSLQRKHDKYVVKQVNKTNKAIKQGIARAKKITKAYQKANKAEGKGSDPAPKGDTSATEVSGTSTYNVQPLGSVPTAPSTPSNASSSVKQANAKLAKTIGQYATAVDNTKLVNVKVHAYVKNEAGERVPLKGAEVKVVRDDVGHKNCDAHHSQKAKTPKNGLLAYTNCQPGTYTVTALETKGYTLLSKNKVRHIHFKKGHLTAIVRYTYSKDAKPAKADDTNAPAEETTVGDAPKADPVYSCDGLTAAVDSGNPYTYTFSTKTTATNGPTVASYYYDYGDGHVNSNGGVNQPKTYNANVGDTYTAQVSVIFKLADGTLSEPVTSPACSTTVTTPVPTATNQ